MFTNEIEQIVHVSVSCDICGASRKIGTDLNFDGRMNNALRAGYTFKQEGNVFKNYCRECQGKEHDNEYRVKMYIQKCGYSYSVDDVVNEYKRYLNEPRYVSYTMKDCFNHLEYELIALVGEE